RITGFLLFLFLLNNPISTSFLYKNNNMGFSGLL
ncbi:MAG: hypothetical protein ACJASR_002092, partial [Psychroserpens sp.]